MKERVPAESSEKSFGEKALGAAVKTGQLASGAVAVAKVIKFIVDNWHVITGAALQIEQDLTEKYGRAPQPSRIGDGRGTLWNEFMQFERRAFDPRLTEEDGSLLQGEMTSLLSWWMAGISEAEKEAVSKVARTSPELSMMPPETRHVLRI